MLACIALDVTCARCIISPEFEERLKGLMTEVEEAAGQVNASWGEFGER